MNGWPPVHGSEYQLDMLAAFLVFLRDRQAIWRARDHNSSSLPTKNAIFLHKKFTNIFRQVFSQQ
jgi:hypothetical protein